MFPLKSSSQIYSLMTALPTRPKRGCWEIRKASHDGALKNPLSSHDRGRIIYVNITSKGAVLLLELRAGSAAGQSATVSGNVPRFPSTVSVDHFLEPDPAVLPHRHTHHLWHEQEVALVSFQPVTLASFKSKNTMTCSHGQP